MWNSKLSRRKFLDMAIRSSVCCLLGYPVIIEPNWLVLEIRSGPGIDMIFCCSFVLPGRKDKTPMPPKAANKRSSVKAQIGIMAHNRN